MSECACTPERPYKMCPFHGGFKKHEPKPMTPEEQAIMDAER